jgi:hypothetical protein
VTRAVCLQIRHLPSRSEPSSRDHEAGGAGVVGIGCDVFGAEGGICVGGGLGCVTDRSSGPQAVQA